MPFIIIFFLIPLAEVYAFMTVGREIGVLSTLMLCVLTAIIGGFLVRLQGIGTLMKAQNNLRAGSMPLDEIFNGFCIVIAGALLLTPGFFTDTIGFLLLFPPFRMILKQFISKNADFDVGSSKNTAETNNGDIIEGDYERVEKTAPPLDNQTKDD